MREFDLGFGALDWLALSATLVTLGLAAVGAVTLITLAIRLVS